MTTIVPQLINVGATANDGTGDKPRAVGLKVNASVQALADALNGNTQTAVALRTQALADMDLVAVRNNLKIGFPVFRPESYGAKCDGITDDSAAWAALIAALPSGGGAVIWLPPSPTRCQGGIIKLPDRTSILGHGLSSEICWQGNDTQQAGAFLIDLSGPNGANPIGYQCLMDFKLSGNSAGGKAALIRSYYNAHNVIDNIWVDSASYGAIDAVQLWDTRITKVQGEFIGTHPDSAAIWIRNSAATSGFGYSSDTSNQIFIADIRLEDSFGNDIRIEQGPGSSYPPNGIFITRLKGESNHRLNRSSIYLGSGVTLCTIRDAYIASQHFSPYYASSNYAPHYGIENHGNGSNVISQVRVEQGDNGLIRAAILQASTGLDHLQDISFEAQQGQAPTDGVLVAYSGTVPPIVTGFFTSTPDVPKFPSNVGPLLPSNVFSGAAAISGVEIDGSTIVASTSTPYQMQAANRVVDVNKTTGAATKLLLPTSPTLWVDYTIIDGKGDAATNNITITGGSGVTINGQSSFVINGNNFARSFRPVNATTWRIA